MLAKHAAARRGLLRTIPALATCTDRELGALAELVDDVSVSEGTILIEQGAAGHQAFVIVEGWAAVTVHGEPVAALGPGQLVGEMALLDAGPRSATVVAKTPMRVLVVGSKAFASLTARPEVAQTMTRTLSQRLRAADTKLARRVEPPES